MMEYQNLQIEVPVEDLGKHYSENILNPAWEKKYHNVKGFVVGLDLQSQESRNRKLSRAKRFGLKEALEEEELKDPFLDISIKSIDWPAVTDAALAQTRPEAVHLYGVDDMSTKDVFDYFKTFGPDTMEWIDDHSCNVLWESEQSAALALKGSSRTYEELSKLKGEKEEPETIDEAEEEARELWRIALPYKKTTSLFMRLATVEDKKMPGAAKRSMYYLKHGMGRGRQREGLVSASRKRKMKQANDFMHENVKVKRPDVSFLEVEDEESESDQDESMVVSDDSDEPSSKLTKVTEKGSSMRMRLHAGDKKSTKKDILDKIGTEQLKIEVTTSFEKEDHWTAGRKNQHRRDASSSEEDEEEDEDEIIDVIHSSLADQRKRFDDEGDLREGLVAKSSKDASHIKSRSDLGHKVPDLRQKLHKNKKHLGLTKDQLNLCIEVTEVSDED